jgi:hypothetical protein
MANKKSQVFLWPIRNLPTDSAVRITYPCWVLVEDVRRDPVQVVVDGFGQHHREAGLVGGVGPGVGHLAPPVGLRDAAVAASPPLLQVRTWDHSAPSKQKKMMSITPSRSLIRSSPQLDRARYARAYVPFRVASAPRRGRRTGWRPPASCSRRCGGSTPRTPGRVGAWHFPSRPRASGYE